MDSILFVDKPKGISSFDVIRELRQRLGVKKMGHAGTLDPMATGLLVVGVGKGTKRLAEFVGLPKTYRMTIRLGTRTDTGDLEGRRLEERQVKSIAAERARKTLAGMVGDLELAVPAYSALKHKGHPLYYYARRGLAVPEKRRTTRIHRLELLGVKSHGGKTTLGVELKAAKGTYARAVAEEVGRRLGLPATLAELRRTKIGAIDVRQAKPLSAFRGIASALPTAHTRRMPRPRMPSRSLLAAAVALAIPAAALAGPELCISPKGELHITGVELTTKNALNLFTVATWGLKWGLPIDQWTKLEAADGSPIALEDIKLGHQLEIKGRIIGEREPLDVRLIRDLSVGTPVLSRVEPPPQPAAISTALTPPPPAPAGAAPPPVPAPAPAPIPSGQRFLTQNLKLGMRGGEVIILQEFLQKNNWGIPDDGPVTGYYGKVTVSAVKKFQAANGLPPEGEVGPKTRAAINELLKQ